MELAEVRGLADSLAFPEGPIAMQDGSVLVLEIRAGRVSVVTPNGQVDRVATVGGGPNGAAVGPDGAVYICNNGGRADGPRCAPSIQRLELDTGRCEFVYTACDSVPLGGPNDIVFDEGGGFWFTDFTRGDVLYASADGSQIRRVLGGLDHPNGIGLSPDQSVLYFSQTFTRQVLRRRLAGVGEVVPSAGYNVRAVLAGGDPDAFTVLAGLGGAQELDSLAVDSTGAVCVGTLVESGVTVISEDGSHVSRLTLPDGFADRVVTNICFGGDDMRTAYITLSETGRLISCRWPVPGLPLAFAR